MKKIRIQISKLFNILDVGQKIGKEYYAPEGIYIKTPSGELTPVLGFVRKHKDSIEVEFEDHTILAAAKKHIIQSNNKMCFLEDVDVVDTISGSKNIINKKELGDIDLYDICVPEPHLYVTPDGIIHHNTLYLLQIAKSFLDKNDENVVVYFDSEGSVTKDQLEQFSIDTRRFIIIPVSTIEDFRTQAIRVLDSYQERYGKGGETRMLVALDSLGNLSSKKEVEDITSGKDTRDMTKAQLNRGAFRVIGLKCSVLNVPLVVTNHTYDVVGAYVPTKEISGGAGLKYVADQIVMLSKSKLRDDDREVIGAIIKAKLYKSRQTIEQKEVETRLFFDKGLDKYYGLLDIAVKYGIFEKVSTKIVLPDGTSTFEKRIIANPEKYFTKDILDKIDDACKKEFLYQSNNNLEDVANEESQELKEEEIDE